MSSPSLNSRLAAVIYFLLPAPLRPSPSRPRPASATTAISLLHSAREWGE